jgi:hypothetical protein
MRGGESDHEEHREQPVGCVGGKNEGKVMTSVIAPYLLDEDDGEGVEEASRDDQNWNSNPLLSLDDGEDSYQVKRCVDEGRNETHGLEPQWVATEQGIGEFTPPEEFLNRGTRLAPHSSRENVK